MAWASIKKSGGIRFCSPLLRLKPQMVRATSVKFVLLAHWVRLRQCQIARLNQGPFSVTDQVELDFF